MQARRLLQRVRRTIAAHRMLTPGDAVLVGVSGGPDSVALVHLLRGLASGLRLRLGIIHLNHGLRGADSDSDADFVRSLAGELNLPFFKRKADVNSFRKTHGLSLEEASRRVRYAYFAEIAGANHYNRVALGHHGDDNAELVLMNLIRGSGPQGLSGIPPVREDLYIRPLIDLSREEIEGFLDEEKIYCVIDASNKDPRHRRNRIRHELIPSIRDAYNPDISGALSRLAAIMRDENAWIDGMAETAFRDCILAQEDDLLILSPARLASLETPLARRVLRKALLEIRHDLRRIRYVHIDAIYDLIGNSPDDEPTEKEIHLPHRIHVQGTGNRIMIRRSPHSLREASASAGPNIHDFNYLVREPDAGAVDLHIREINARMRFSTLAGTALPDDLSSSTTACFDFDALVFPLTVRPPRPGDRFIPLGMRGSQKLKDFFINRKIPRSERGRCPLLISGDAVIWIAGLRTAEFGKATAHTQKLLKVELSLA